MWWYPEASSRPPPAAQAPYAQLHSFPWAAWPELIDVLDDYRHQQRACRMLSVTWAPDRGDVVLDSDSDVECDVGPGDLVDDPSLLLD